MHEQAYRLKPAVVQALTFDQFVQHGRDNGANIVNGMPWSFQYRGEPVSHENDKCYLIGAYPQLRFGPHEMLVTGVQGDLYTMEIANFNKTYEPA